MGSAYMRHRPICEKVRYIILLLMIFDQHYMMFTIMENYDIVDRKQRYKSVYICRGE